MKSVLVVSPDRHDYIEPLRRHLKYDLVCVLTPQDINFSDPPLAVIVMADWTYDLSRFIEKCRTYRVPTILMMDGTIEWNHFFENPQWYYGQNETPYIPTYCDKIFTPGLSTFRFLEFFGNSGKCEPTGLPRFDKYKINIDLLPCVSEVVRVGVMSSNTAGYIQSQIDDSIALFTAVNEVLGNNKSFELKWRLRKGFNDKLSFIVDNSPERGLEEFLENVDVVISQPSTAAYEAMLLGKPTAIADFGNAPNYMRGAWEINKPDQILSIVREMCELPKYKALLQNYLLNDTISNAGVSAKICAATIEDMIDHVSILGNEQWFFPTNISNKYSIVCPKEYNVQNRYELNDYECIVEKLVKAQVKIVQLEQKFSKRSFGFWIERFVKRLAKLIMC